KAYVAAHPSTSLTMSKPSGSPARPCEAGSIDDGFGRLSCVQYELIRQCRRRLSCGAPEPEPESAAERGRDQHEAEQDHAFTEAPASPPQALKEALVDQDCVDSDPGNRDNTVEEPVESVAREANEVDETGQIRADIGKQSKEHDGRGPPDDRIDLVAQTV